MPGNKNNSTVEKWLKHDEMRILVLDNF